MDLRGALGGISNNDAAISDDDDIDENAQASRHNFRELARFYEEHDFPRGSNASHHYGSVRHEGCCVT